MRLISCIICVLVAAVFSSTLDARDLKDGVVTGLVVAQSTGQPLATVTVVLFNRKDSSMVSGSETDKKGKFILNGIPYGSYYAVFSCVGYTSTHSSPVTIDASQGTHDLGTITLAATAIRLHGMEVPGKAPTAVNAIDRKIYNVQRDVTAQSESASELLQKIPAVSVDIDGNVSLRGSSNVLILIDGRQSPLMDKNQADILQQLPANSIERVEVITNPSAKYKPNGTAGIINLVLRKDTNRGFGGTVSVNGGIDSRYNTNITFNYNPGRFNLFGSYGLRKDLRNRRSGDARQYYYSGPDTSSYYSEADTAFDRPLANLASLGVDYHAGKHDKLGVSGDLFYRSFNRYEDLISLSRDNEQTISGDYQRRRVDHEVQKDNEALAYFEHSFRKSDNKIRIEYSYANQPEDENNHYANSYTVPVASPTYDNTLIKQGEIHSQLTVDYSDPISDKSELDAGLSHEIRNDDFDYYVSYLDTASGAFVTDPLKTSHFTYDQRIEAAYATYKNSIGKLGFLAGLRYEYLHNSADLITTDSAFAVKFSHFFPTLHLAYQLSESSELQLNYSNRTNWPEGEDLDPFQEYRDPLNVRVGNPNLLPEYIHSVEFGWQAQRGIVTFTPSVFYRYRYNVFTVVSRVIQDSILETTHTNLAHDQSAGMEFVLDFLGKSFISGNASLDVFYNQIDATNLGYSAHKSVVTSSGSLNLDFNVEKRLVFQVNSNYRSARLTPQGRFVPSGVLNLGGRYTIIDGRLSAMLTVSDLFNSRRFKLQLSSSGITRNFMAHRDTRVIYAGLNLRLGTAQKKGKEKALQYDTGG